MPLLGSLGAGSSRGFGGIGAAGGGAVDPANANFDTLLDSAQDGATNTYNVTSGTTYGVRIWGGGASGGKSHHPSTFSLGGRGSQIEGFVVSQGNHFRLSSGSSASSANDSNGSSGGGGGLAGRGGGSGGYGDGSSGGGGAGGAGASVLQWSNDGNSWTTCAVAGGGGGGGGNDQGQDHSTSGSNSNSAKGGDAGFFLSNTLGEITSGLYASGANGTEGGQNSSYPGNQGFGGGGGTANSSNAGAGSNSGSGEAGTAGLSSGNGGAGGNTNSGNAGGGGGGGGGFRYGGGGGGGSQGGVYSQAGGGGGGCSYLDGSVFVYLKQSSVSNSGSYGFRGQGPTSNGGATQGGPGRIELWEVS